MTILERAQALSTLQVGDILTTKPFEGTAIGSPMPNCTVLAILAPGHYLISNSRDEELPGYICTVKQLLTDTSWEPQTTQPAA